VDEEAAPEPVTAVIDFDNEPSAEKSVDKMIEQVDEAGLRNEIKQYQDEAEKLIEARGRENYAAEAGNLKQAKDLYEE
jgi:hypothetical protein